MASRLGGRVLALALSLLILTGSITAVLFFRPLYYFDIDHLKIAEASGLSPEECRANYDAVIDYSSIHSDDPLLTLPTLPMSESGRIHFAEVRDIFHVVQYLFALSGALCVFLGVSRFRARDFSSLRPAGVLTLLPVGAVCLLLLFGWERAFVLFHKLFFRNDYWLFDPISDPVITILPSAFFAHCALSILVLWVLGGVILLVAASRLSPRRG